MAVIEIIPLFEFYGSSFHYKFSSSRVEQWFRSQANSVAAARWHWPVTGLAKKRKPSASPAITCGYSTSPAPPPPTNAPALCCLACGGAKPLSFK
ncbi:MAG TPA: hypothetical protein ENJ32_05950 [Crenotrichaceae bacterium]|nr:hypothetical protein [Crenotrichaceae bacterium]